MEVSMEANSLPRIEAATAAEVCRTAHLTRGARKLLQDGDVPADYLHRLVEHQRPADAIGFLVAALPRREAVWWACVCVEMSKKPEARSPEESAALGTAVRWVIDPSEKKRVATLPRASAAGRTPSAYIAQAVYVSGENMAPPNVPPLAPDPRMAPALLKGAIVLTAGGTNDARFLALGIQIANGQHRWEEKKPAGQS
jgi:hypothetical protein